MTYSEALDRFLAATADYARAVGELHSSADETTSAELDAQASETITKARAILLEALNASPNMRIVFTVPALSR